MKFNVLVTHKLLPEAMAYLQSHADLELCPEKDALTKQDIIQKIRDKDGLLCLLTDEIDREIIAAASKNLVQGLRGERPDNLVM